MRRAVRAIIINDNKLLVMHRNKFGQEYDTLPGGNVEMHETPEQSLRREIFEETSLRVGTVRFVFLERAGEPWGDQVVYVCEYQGGEPVLLPTSDEAKIHAMGSNLYEPRWLAIADLPDSAFLSESLKQAILVGVEHGWPKTAVEITGFDQRSRV